MTAMPINGKNSSKIFFSETSRPMTFEFGIKPQTQTYKVCSNDDPGLSLTYFTARSALLPYAFVWENAEVLDFRETIEVYEQKGGKNSWWSEYMKTYEYQRSRSFFDLCPRSLRFILSNILPSCWTYQSQISCRAFMIRGTKVCSNDGDYMAKMAAMPVFGYIFRNLLWNQKTVMITGRCLLIFFTERLNMLPVNGLESGLA